MGLESYDDDDEDDDNDDDKSDGDSEEGDTVQANMDEDMDQFRLPGVEESEKEGENSFFLLLKKQISQKVLVSNFCFF